MCKPISREFFSQASLSVARQLLGKYLVTHEAAGQIIETEAYHQDEASCHAFGGKRTPRNASMFAVPGTLYVYRIHQVFCLNISTEAEGIGAAVLIRALLPTPESLASMQARRPVKQLTQLSNGPGKLCQALGINRSWDGQTLGQQLWFEDRGISYAEAELEQTSRIGISRAQDLAWRFVIPHAYQRQARD